MGFISRVSKFMFDRETKIAIINSFVKDIDNSILLQHDTINCVFTVSSCQKGQTIDNSFYYTKDDNKSLKKAEKDAYNMYNPISRKMQNI